MSFNRSIVAAYARDYPPLITPQQAARIAQRSTKTIYDWSSRGLLEACKVGNGRSIRFSRDCFVNKLLEGF